jgi:hypothetical protein
MSFTKSRGVPAWKMHKPSRFNGKPGNGWETFLIFYSPCPRDREPDHTTVKGEW